MKLRYSDRSKDDLEIAFTWYEGQKRGLGFEFLDCVEAALQSNAYQILKCIKNVIHNFADALYEDSRFQYFIQLNLMK